MKKSLPLINTRSKTREEEEFRAWIKRETSIQGRSVNDVCSRLRRVLSMISIKPGTTEPGIKSKLLLSKDFMECTTSVKSQLRRVAKLYLLFINGQVNRN